MTLKTITLQLPENIYIRLQQVAQATKQSFDEVLLRVVQVGSPPTWDDIPPQFQTDVAALDRLDDGALWQVARRKQTEADMVDYQALLDKNANQTISVLEQRTLHQLRVKFDRLMLCKAHAVALLRWRGHQIPPADRL